MTSRHSCQPCFRRRTDFPIKGSGDCIGGHCVLVFLFAGHPRLRQRRNGASDFFQERRKQKGQFASFRKAAEYDEYARDKCEML